MRILTGSYKGKRLVMPDGLRPTQDKVRKALFDILGDIQGLSFLDLFAGSGAVGLEASSRGAGPVVLIESHPAAQLAIRKNIAGVGAAACELYPLEAEKAIAVFKRNRAVFDIVFLDPPYYLDLARKTLQSIGACDIVAPNGLVVAQHFKKDDLPEILGVLRLCKQWRYGDTCLSLYHKE